MSEGTILTLMIIGIAVIVLLAFPLWLSRVYVKAPSNRAFIRTGGGNQEPKVIINGRALVFAPIHEVTWVDLGTMAIEMQRSGENALLTGDPLYADIRAIFYLKVEPTTDGIMTAARTIGGKRVDQEAVEALVEAKLESALRDVAATFTLMSLHYEREHFIEAVQERLKDDLLENGLVLASLSISTLRGTRLDMFPIHNTLDAEVLHNTISMLEAARQEKAKVMKQLQEKREKMERR